MTQEGRRDLIQQVMLILLRWMLAVLTSSSSVLRTGQEESNNLDEDLWGRSTYFCSIEDRTILQYTNNQPPFSEHYTVAIVLCSNYQRVSY